MSGERTSKRVRLLLERLRGVELGASGWSAYCPAHDDFQASLNVSVASDGRPVMNCHAGCDPHAVVSSLGWRPADFFGSADDTAAGADKGAEVEAEAGPGEGVPVREANGAFGGARVRTLAEILADPETLKPPPIAVPRLAWKGRVTLLAAREKAGKSTLASAAASAVTRGGAFLDGLCAPGHVAWFALEEHTADLAARFVEFGAVPERMVVVDELSDAFAEYARVVERVRPALVVVDTLAAFVDQLGERPDSGSSAGWTPIMSRLVSAARKHDAALVILHHGRKSDGSYRDSSAIGAGVDAILELSEDSRNKSVRKIKTRSRRTLVEDYSITLESGHYELVGSEPSLRSRVLRFVGSNPGCSQNAVRNGVQGRNQAVDDELSTLIAGGEIEDQGDGQSGRRLHLRQGPPADRIRAA